LRLIDSCITQHTVQGPSRTCNESKEEEEECEESTSDVVLCEKKIDREYKPLVQTGKNYPLFRPANITPCSDRKTPPCYPVSRPENTTALLNGFPIGSTTLSKSDPSEITTLFNSLHPILSYIWNEREAREKQQVASPWNPDHLSLSGTEPVDRACTSIYIYVYIRTLGLSRNLLHENALQGADNTSRTTGQIPLQKEKTHQAV